MLESNLEYNMIWTLRFSYSIIQLAQKLKIRWDMLESNFESN